MSHTPDGGPAFGRAGATIKRWDGGDEREETFLPLDGMTLRDYFAAKALPVLISRSPNHKCPVGFPCEIVEECARGAYDYADAMLRAREK